MKAPILFLLLLSACHPAEPVVAGVNAAFGYRAISLAADCQTSIFTDSRTHCVRLEWDTLKPGQLGRTECYRGLCTVTLANSIRDDGDQIRSVLAHELGHVLGLADDPVSGRLMSKHLTEHAERLVGELPRLVAGTER